MRCENEIDGNCIETLYRCNDCDSSTASDGYDTKKCPDCGEVVTFDSSPDFNRIKPWEVYCEACGWFHPDRFVSIGDAASAEP